MLLDKRILIVEDEPLIALDLESAIRVWQGLGVGPAHCLAYATRFASSEPLHGAILDLRLQDDLVTDVIPAPERPSHCLYHAHGGVGCNPREILTPTYPSSRSQLCQNSFCVRSWEQLT